MRELTAIILIITALNLNLNAQSKAHGPNDPNFEMTCKTGQKLSYTITSNTEPYTVILNGFDLNSPEAKKFEIPTSVNYRNKEFVVTKIKENAFADNTSFASVTLPNKLQHIGNNAFKNCSKLNKIVLSEGIESCGENAFLGTAINAAIYSGSTLVYFPNAAEKFIIKENTTKILDYAFSNCLNLSKIEIPAAVSEIGIKAFWNCNNLTKISVATENKVYDSRENCNAIVRTKDNTLFIGFSTSILPKSVKQIGKKAFAGIKITEMSFDGELENIEDSAFYSSGITKVDLQANIKSVGRSAFAQCKNLGVVNYNLASEIEVDAEHLPFENCNSLVTVNIGENVSIIPAYLFKNSTELRYVEFTNNLKEIKKEAFAGCQVLSYVEIPNSVEIADGTAFIETGISDPVHNEHLFVYLPSSYGNEYSIPEGITRIGENAFYQNQTLESIKIPESVTTICDYAFTKTARLNNIIVPNSVTKIGKFAFSYNEQLNKIQLPTSLKRIEEGTFYMCVRLKEIALPEGVEYLGRNLFYWCDMLETITLPSTITEMEQNALTSSVAKKIIVPIESKNKYEQMLPVELQKLIIVK